MRKDLLAPSFLAVALAIGTQSPTSSSHYERNVEWSMSPEEAFKKMGVDGRTVLSAHNMSVFLRNRSGDKAIRWATQLDGVDIILNAPIKATDSGSAREYYASIPMVTGVNAHYEARIGSGGMVLSDVRFSREESDQKLANYLVVDRYYDNKIVNATTAVLAIAESMAVHGIMPGETFSYLQVARIQNLLDTNQVLMGKGIGGIGNGKRGLVNMKGGGICTSVTAIAKMARVAETQNIVRISKITPHSVPSLRYFMNPDDPTPHQVDATALSPDTDFRFINTSDSTLFVVPRIQIIADQVVKKGYNSLHDSTAVFVLSVTLQKTPPRPNEIDTIKRQLTEFRERRGI